MRQDMIFGKYLTHVANDVPVSFKVDLDITADCGLLRYKMEGLEII